MKYLIKSTGQTIIADLAFVEAHYPGDFTEIVEAPEPAPTVRAITKLQFLRLMTQAERINLRQAAKVSPVMGDFMHLLDIAQDVSKDDPDVIAALQEAEQAGLLDAGRAAEILA